MIGPAWLQRVAATRPLLLDLTLAAVLSGLSLVPLVFGLRPDGYVSTWGDGVAAAVAFVLIAARRRAPLAVLALALLGCAVVTAVTPATPHVLGVTAMIALYTVVTRTARRGTAAALALGTAAVLYGVNAAADHAVFDPENLDVVAWAGMAAALGGAVRTWREYVAAIEERAARAEATKEEEARRRVAEERLRIARELHDVIAHHIALINVQAGVASHLLRTQPDRADDALGHIRDAGRTVLDELASLLLVLRRSGDDGTETAEPTEPVPGLSRLGGLVESLAAAGLRVRHEQAGVPRQPPIAVDLAAYRIIQEGLTNAHKHGRGEARLRVEYRPDALVVQIRNPLPAESRPPAGTGHGLTGMRERAQAVGGSLHAGTEPDGTFRLDARLPLPEVAATGVTA